MRKQRFRFVAMLLTDVFQKDDRAEMVKDVKDGNEPAYAEDDKVGRCRSAKLIQICTAHRYIPH